MNPPPSDAATVAEPLHAVNTAHLVCDFCQSAAPEHLIPLQGKHVHACPGFRADGALVAGDFDAYFQGQFVAGRRTRMGAQQELDLHVLAQFQHGLVTTPAATLGAAPLDRPLADFDDADGVTHRTVTVAELEQATDLLCRQTNGHALRSLAEQVVAAHAIGQLQFRSWSGILEVASWSTDGQLVEVTPFGECQACESQTCLHAILHALLAIRERGMTVLVRRERYGNYSYEQVAA